MKDKGTDRDQEKELGCPYVSQAQKQEVMPKWIRKFNIQSLGITEEAEFRMQKSIWKLDL